MDTVVKSTGKRRLALLGSTGSIGTSTLDVVRSLPGELEIVGLTAHSRWQELFQQAKELNPRYVVLTDPNPHQNPDTSLLPPGCRFLCGADGVHQLVTDPDVDLVLTAIVGSAGLQGTLAALEAGKTVCVANKETLVMAGPLVMDLARRKGGQLLPVDSEHSAIFQALRGNPIESVERVVLTGSGGPFRGKSRNQLENVTIDQALQHPTWKMGPKITVDSATLMNKALEVIEARWLFDFRPDQIDVIIHPESVIHSFVEYCDGSVMAQMSPPDMRLPIQYALLYPRRLPGPTRRLQWRELANWHFEQPDHETFPALQLGLEVAQKGGTCGAILNAANEAAVQRFLNGTLSFLDIPRACRMALDHHHYSPTPSLAELGSCDRWARQEIARWTSPRTQNAQTT